MMTIALCIDNLSFKSSQQNSKASAASHCRKYEAQSGKISNGDCEKRMLFTNDLFATQY